MGRERGREAGRRGLKEEGKGEGILYMLFFSSQDIHTGHPRYSGDGFDAERKEKTLVGTDKSVVVVVVPKLCVLSCMPL